MVTKKYKYIIVGAGLSGLTTANQLLYQKEDDFLILEARERIGGRIITKSNIELGATWFQNHHTHLSHLLKNLKLQKFPQYSQGKSVLVYNSMAPTHYFETDPTAPSAYRVANGSISLIDRLAKNLLNKTHLDTTVTYIEETENTLCIKTNTGNSFSCEKLVITIPPKLASNIIFEPSLDEAVLNAMKTTHTWMSNAIKVGLSFKTPFWKKQGFSGTVIGQSGAVTELYDHCNYTNDSYNLMGFVNEGLRDLSSEERKERILTYLEQRLSKNIRNYINYYEKDWSQDAFTSNKNIKSVYISPQYGNPLFQFYHMNGKLLFSGAETSPVHGGYMDGAIYSGLMAVKKLLNINS